MIWLAIYSIPVLATAFVALITGTRSVLTFLGIMGWILGVLALWWADTKKSPIKLHCPNCGAVTEGTLGTYLKHGNASDIISTSVQMKCPSCGQEGTLKGDRRQIEKDYMDRSIDRYLLWVWIKLNCNWSSVLLEVVYSAVAL